MSDVLTSATSLYPERRVLPEAAADRQVRLLLGRGLQRLRPQLRALARAAAQAGEQEAAVRRLTDLALSQAVAAAAPPLWRHGRGLPLALALVRECARRSLGLRPHDVQLMGAACLLSGRLAEMQTGEGKTLTAGLAAALVAAGRVPVHVITVNDYLAERDAQELAPLYRFLGLRTGTVVSGLSLSARAAAYGCDITYCTGKELVFDYLKDRSAAGAGASQATLALQAVAGGDRTAGTLLRGLHFALVDEADSIFIDEARTPLILAEKAGLPRRPALYGEALALARRMVAGMHYRLSLPRRAVDLTHGGRAWLTEQAVLLGHEWTGRAAREHLALQALRALHLFHADDQYIVRDGKVQIVDEQTGRMLDGRTWEQGLHQLLEVKEGCEMSEHTRTRARITYQRFFRRYLRLSGMTGTARDVAGELWSVYGLHTVRIPTHRPVRRTLLPTECLPTKADKQRRLTQQVRALMADGRAVLVGTRSVADSQALSACFQTAGIAHRVLNARQDADEAELVRQAGQPGAVTIATDMAGRGTDIKLHEAVRDRGGLHVLMTAFHDARRVDRQLLGRAARQGDPGSAQAIVALDDELFTVHAALPQAVLLALARRLRLPTAGWLAVLLRHLAQRRASRVHRAQRQEAARRDDQLARSLGFTGQG